ncbi:hypothetical protein KFU94_45490 [Chloroflexi bacterium TSY]|nr:hypothetical protein [Chloroflexi bacterium TSY]
MGRKRITLSMLDEAVDVIKRNSTERKQGEFVSSLLLQYDENKGAPIQMDEIRFLLLSINERLQSVEQRLNELACN